MAHFNKVIIAGKLDDIPELKRSSKGRSYTYVKVGLKGVYRGDDGGYDSKYAMEVEVLALDSLAEEITDIALRNMEVLMEGRLHYSTTISGKRRRTSVQMIVENFLVLSSPADHLTEEDKAFLSQLPPLLRKAMEGKNNGGKE